MGHFNVRSDLSPLLLDRHIPYYWVGFILADGTVVNNRLTVTLSNEDSGHLIKLANLVKSTTRHHKDRLIMSCQDKELVPQICKKFNLKPRKTYNPPDQLPNCSNYLLKSMFIGFVDGDGTIGYQYGRTSTLLRIKCHKSWLYWLKDIKHKLSLQCAEPYVKEYCLWNIGTTDILKDFKQHALKHRLPILKRKWNKIVA